MQNLSSPVALDVETTGVKRQDTADPRLATFVVAAIAPQGLATYRPPTLTPGAKVTVHNLPYDAVVLKHWDAEWDDTKVLAHMGGQPDTTLKGMVSRILERPVLHYEEAVEQDKLAPYCLADAQNTWDLRPLLYGALPPPTRDLYDSLEKPLLPLWCKMTMEGSFALDREPLLEYRTALSGNVDLLRGQVQALLPHGREMEACAKCGLTKEKKEKGQKCEDGKNHAWGWVYLADEPVNLNSPVHQLLPALKGLGLDIANTDADTLRQAIDRHPVVRELLAYKGAHKELSTYIDPWCEIAERGELLGAIWRPTGVRSGGRISSAYPNLMNIPEVLKRFHKAPREDEELLTYDNSQLEIRIAAHVSQDPELLRACRAGDFHAEMMEVTGLPGRKATKVAVFGSMYLGGPNVILRKAREYDMPMTWPQAEGLQKRVYTAIPDYFHWAHNQAEEREFIDVFGRYHAIPLGADGDKHEERQAVNDAIQPPAGTVTKYQMLALWRAGYRVVCQVHDSVSVSVPKTDLEDAKRDVPAIMEAAAPELDVPIKVEVQ